MVACRSLTRALRLLFPFRNTKGGAIASCKALNQNFAREKSTSTQPGGVHPQLQRRISQPTSYTHPHLLTDKEITPGITRQEYAERRRQLGRMLPEKAILLFPSNPKKNMSEDVPYLYHQNTDLLYFTGLSEPDSALIVETVTYGTESRSILFVQPPDATKELWEGPSCGTGDDIRDYFAVDEVRPFGDLRYVMDILVHDAQMLLFDAELNLDASAHYRDLQQRSQERFMDIWRSGGNAKRWTCHLRLIKSHAEIELMRQSCDAIAGGLNDAMTASTLSGKHGTVSERLIEGAIEYGCKRRGATRMAFPCVVASGQNATILHYMHNSQVAHDGDLVMVDAGCEVHGYCSDVSRTWPVSGKFGGPQRDLYELVLLVQKMCIDKVRAWDDPNGKHASYRHLEDIHYLAVWELTQGLLDLGFMPGMTCSEALSTGAYQRYFPHATSHYLGMDVHDTHDIPRTTQLRENMVVTVEPGLYVRAEDETAPECFRGIGIRIEDYVLVGPASREPEVFSASAVKEIDDIEHLVGSAK